MTTQNIHFQEILSKMKSQ